MNRKQINELLSNIGWTGYHMEPGTAQQMKLEEKIVTIYVVNDTFGVDLNPSVSVSVFDKLEHTIGGHDVDYVTGKFVRRRYVAGSVIDQTQIRIRKHNYGVDDILALSRQAIDWATAVDIEAGLAKLRALPISSLGAMPVRHMAALAVAGDVETLRHYHVRFAVGDRMDCVPYITIDYITRALELAEKRKADPNWIPDKPKIRV